MPFQRVCVNLESEQVTALKQHSADTGVPLSEQIRRAIAYAFTMPEDEQIRRSMDYISSRLKKLDE
jgi:ribosomal 50S subunit-associated protein YjgA (DUF615 family)